MMVVRVLSYSSGGRWRKERIREREGVVRWLLEFYKVWLNLT
jgi:hypothetical protein